MSADRSTTAAPVSSPTYTPARSASYLPCRRCGEGSLVYDDDLGTSVCRCCGAVDD